MTEPVDVDKLLELAEPGWPVALPAADLRSLVERVIRAEQGWRPIGEAKKDGSWMLLTNGRWVTEGQYHTWIDGAGVGRGLWKPANALNFPINTFNPTHFMPLPSPPKDSPNG
jgi:hypothetical protein